MADNINDDTLDTPITPQSENISDEIISLNDTDFITPNQETENMEVHKHPHHVTHKKKWGEYILEFLMLFLAVFLGFVAENIREHKVEKERGIRYVSSFCEDLKKDTASLTILINDYTRKVEKLNLISACYDSLSLKLPCNTCLTELFINSQYFWGFIVSDGTMQQLKNAGGLRLLNSADADSVSTYDFMVKSYKTEETTLMQETQNSVRNIMAEMFSYPVARNAIKNGSPLKGEMLVTNDKVIISKYFNRLSNYNVYSIRNINLAKEIKLSATGLLNYFKKKYGTEIEK